MLKLEEGVDMKNVSEHGVLEVKARCFSTLKLTIFRILVHGPLHVRFASRCSLLVR